MRFPRQAKIFRGQLDAAPVAAVFFLLVLMLLLQYSHTFLPGVRVQLGEAPASGELPERTLRITKEGLISFREKEYQVGDLEKYFREVAQEGKLPKSFFIEIEPGANPAITRRVQDVALEVGTRLKPPGSRLELPDFAGFPGTTNPVVVVSLNLNGQIFFEHQFTRSDLLEERLAQLVQRTDGSLTMVLQADKAVPYSRIVEVMGVARKAGIKEVSLATRPPVEPQ
jgi:biopolymer transport protein ExbD